MINRILVKLGLVNIRKGKNVRLQLNKCQLKINRYSKIRIYKGTFLSADKLGEISLGNNVKICENCKLLACNGSIQIGEGTQVGDNW